MLDLNIQPWKPTTKEDAIAVGKAEEAGPIHHRTEIEPLRKKALGALQKAEKAIDLAADYLARLDDAIDRDPKRKHVHSRWLELAARRQVTPKEAALQADTLARMKASIAADRTEYAAITEVPTGADMWMKFEWTVPESGRDSLPARLRGLAFDGERVRGHWEHNALKLGIVIEQMRDSISDARQGGPNGTPKKFARNYVIEFLADRGDGDKQIAMELKRQRLDHGPIPAVVNRVRAHLNAAELKRANATLGIQMRPKRPPAKAPPKSRRKVPRRPV